MIALQVGYRCRHNKYSQNGCFLLCSDNNIILSCLSMLGMLNTSMCIYVPQIFHAIWQKCNSMNQYINSYGLSRYIDIYLGGIDIKVTEYYNQVCMPIIIRYSLVWHIVFRLYERDVLACFHFDQLSGIWCLTSHKC